MAEQLRGPFEKFMESHHSKKRPSPRLHKVPTRSNKVRTHLIIRKRDRNRELEPCGRAVTVSFSNKVSPRTF
jgi:hypothetical protein